jgi:cytochrome c peroxidase
MASAARSASRAFLRSTSSFRPAARSARFALPAQGFRASARRGYASEAGEKKGGSGGIFALAIAVAGGAGAYFYLNGESTKGPFVPTKEDYQKVYDEIAYRMANETDYDDGSYGPVCYELAQTQLKLSTNTGVSIGPRSSCLARQRYL